MPAVFTVRIFGITTKKPKQILSYLQGFCESQDENQSVKTDKNLSLFSQGSRLRRSCSNQQKKQTLPLQRLFGGEEVIRSFASIAVPGISLRRLLLGLCRPLPLAFSPFSRPRRRSKSQAHASVARVRINKKTDAAVATSVWRRRSDSNTRAAFATYTLSRGASSPA